MSRKVNSILTMTFIGVIMLLSNCKNSAKEQEQVLLKGYALSQAASDYKTTTTLLTQLVALDSIQYAWAVDTLAYYHFINAKFNSDAAELSAASFFVKRGLEQNPDNLMLNILQSDVQLLGRKDTAAIKTLEKAYGKTKSEVYKYFLAQAYATSGRIELSDSMINEGLNGSDSLITKISIQNEINRGWQSVSKKAAYLFLKANYVFSYEFKGDEKSAIKGLSLMNDCLRIEPDFVMSQAYLFQVSQKLQEMGFR